MHHEQLEQYLNSLDKANHRSRSLKRTRGGYFWSKSSQTIRTIVSWTIRNYECSLVEILTAIYDVFFYFVRKGVSRRHVRFHNLPIQDSAIILDSRTVSRLILYLSTAITLPILFASLISFTIIKWILNAILWSHLSLVLLLVALLKLVTDQINHILHQADILERKYKIIISFIKTVQLTHLGSDMFDPNQIFSEGRELSSPSCQVSSLKSTLWRKLTGVCQKYLHSKTAADKYYDLLNESSESKVESHLRMCGFFFQEILPAALNDTLKGPENISSRDLAWSCNRIMAIAQAPLRYVELRCSLVNFSDCVVGIYDLYVKPSDRDDDGQRESDLNGFDGNSIDVRYDLIHCYSSMRRSLKAYRMALEEDLSRLYVMERHFSSPEYMTRSILSSSRDHGRQHLDKILTSGLDLSVEELIRLHKRNANSTDNAAIGYKCEELKDLVDDVCALYYKLGVLERSEIDTADEIRIDSKPQDIDIQPKSHPLALDSPLPSAFDVSDNPTVENETQAKHPSSDETDSNQFIDIYTGTVRHDEPSDSKDMISPNYDGQQAMKRNHRLLQELSISLSTRSANKIERIRVSLLDESEPEDVIESYGREEAVDSIQYDISDENFRERSKLVSTVKNELFTNILSFLPQREEESFS